MDRRSQKKSRKFQKYSEKRFRTSSFRECWTKKKDLKFWYWKKIGKIDKVVNNNHGKYVNIMSHISLGFLTYLLVNILYSI